MAQPIPEKLLRVLNSVVSPITGRAVLEFYNGKRNAVALALLDAYPELRDEAPLLQTKEQVRRLHQEIADLKSRITNQSVCIDNQARRLFELRDAPNRNTAALNAHITRLNDVIAHRSKSLDVLRSRIDHEREIQAAQCDRLNGIINEKNEELQTLKTSKPKNVETHLEASTCHLSAKDRDLLDFASELAPDRPDPEEWINFPRVSAHQYGWAVYLGDDDTGRDAGAAHRLGFSSTFCQVLRRAHKAGVSQIYFDADAAPLDGLRDQEPSIDQCTATEKVAATKKSVLIQGASQHITITVPRGATYSVVFE